METPADRRLAADCRAAGVAVPRAVIRTLRERGLLPAPRVRHLGRGKGTASAYPPEAVELAAAIFAASKGLPRRDLRLAALAAFATGAEVPDRGLRLAYDHGYRFLRAEASRMAERASSPRVEFFGPPGPNDPLIARTILRIIDNDAPPDEGIAAVVKAAGLGPVMAAMDLLHAEKAEPELHEAMDRTALAVLAGAVAAASRDELERARDLRLQLAPMLGIPDDPLTVALDAPVLLPLVKMAPAVT